MNRTAFLVSCLVASVTFAQATYPGLTGLPLELDPAPVLTKSKALLVAAFAETLDRESGAIVQLRGDTERAVTETGRRDFRVADESLVLVAKKLGTLYALYSWLQYTIEGDLVLTGRVVRDDGKVMGTATIRRKRGKEPVLELLHPMAVEYFQALKIAALPVTKPVVGAPVDEKPVEVKPVVKPPEPIAIAKPAAPVEPPTDPLRIVSYAAIGVGAAAAITGVIVYATANPDGVTLSSNRLASPESANRVEGIARTQTLGVTFMAAGAGVAALGAVLFAASSSPVQVSVAPVNGGGAFVSVGGSLP